MPRCVCTLPADASFRSRTAALGCASPELNLPLARCRPEPDNSDAGFHARWTLSCLLAVVARLPRTLRKLYGSRISAPTRWVGSSCSLHAYTHPPYHHAMPRASLFAEPHATTSRTPAGRFLRQNAQTLLPCTGVVRWTHITHTPVPPRSGAPDVDLPFCGLQLGYGLDCHAHGPSLHETPKFHFVCLLRHASLPLPLRFRATPPASYHAADASTTSILLMPLRSPGTHLNRVHARSSLVAHHARLQRDSPGLIGRRLFATPDRILRFVYAPHAPVRYRTLHPRCVCGWRPRRAFGRARCAHTCCLPYATPLRRCPVAVSFGCARHCPDARDHQFRLRATALLHAAGRLPALRTVYVCRYARTHVSHSCHARDISFTPYHNNTPDLAPPSQFGRRLPSRDGIPTAGPLIARYDLRSAAFSHDTSFLQFSAFRLCHYLPPLAFLALVYRFRAVYLAGRGSDTLGDTTRTGHTPRHMLPFCLPLQHAHTTRTKLLPHWPNTRYQRTFRPTFALVSHAPVRTPMPVRRLLLHSPTPLDSGFFAHSAPPGSIICLPHTSCLFCSQTGCTLVSDLHTPYTLQFLPLTAAHSLLQDFMRSGHAAAFHSRASLTQTPLVAAAFALPYIAPVLYTHSRTTRLAHQHPTRWTWTLSRARGIFPVLPFSLFGTAPASRTAHAHP